MHIKIINRFKKNRNLFFCTYSPLLEPAIKNFTVAKTVKVFKGICYIQAVSVAYFTEILANNKIPFSVITTLN